MNIIFFINHNKRERNDFMNNVPNMISTKDLAYLSDLFEMHFVTSKKYESYANKINNPEIKNKIIEIGKKHANYCQKIITLLS